MQHWCVYMITVGMDRRPAIHNAQLQSQQRLPDDQPQETVRPFVALDPTHSNASVLSPLHVHVRLN